MESLIVFVNGTFLPVAEAGLHIEDRGALFGDGVYEYIRVAAGRLFMVREHLNRLRYSAGEIALPIPYGDDEIIGFMNALVRINGIREGGVYLQLTRGAAPRNHLFPDNCTPNFFLVARELHPMPASLYKDGVTAVLLPDERWKRCDIKSLNLLANVLAKEKAKKLGVYDAILYSERGITESTSSSVIAVFDGTIVTTPQGPWVLPGITKLAVDRIAKIAGIPSEERFIGTEEIFFAEELFFTSTRVDVLPIVKLDGKIIGAGVPGPVFRKLHAQFQLLPQELNNA